MIKLKIKTTRFCEDKNKHLSKILFFMFIQKESPEDMQYNAEKTRKCPPLIFRYVILDMLFSDMVDYDR